MIAPAVTTGSAIVAIIGLVALWVVAVVVVHLLESVRRPVAEIEGYASDTLAAGVGIATNLDAVDELERTRELALAVPGLAMRYLKRAGLVR